MADANFLLKHPQYKTFTAKDMACLSKYCEEKSFTAGQQVYCQDDEEAEMSVYFIKTGTISISKIVEGKEKTLGHMKAGDFFGESSLISPAPHSVTVIADNDLILFVLKQSNYERMQKEFPETVFKLLDLFLAGLVLRLREADARLTKKFTKT